MCIRDSTRGFEVATEECNQAAGKHRTGVPLVGRGKPRDTGHEGPERPRGPTGGPLAATDGERRVGRALPRHGHALPTEPAILEFSNSTPLFQLRSSEVLGANVAPRTHGGRRLPGRPPGECAPRSTEAGADAAPRQGARPRVAPTHGTHKSRVAGARTYLRRPSKARGAA